MSCGTTEVSGLKAWEGCLWLSRAGLCRGKSGEGALSVRQDRCEILLSRKPDVWSSGDGLYWGYSLGGCGSQNSVSPQIHIHLEPQM